MTSTHSSEFPRRLARNALLALCFPLSCFAQISNIVTAEPAPKVSAAAGETATAKLRFKIAQGYHTNSNTPSDEYLIPLKLSWEAAPLEVKAVEYPKGHIEKYSFSDKPLSVYTGEFEVTTKFAIPVSAPKGSRTLTGKLRYQACSDNACYPPKTIAVTLPVEIR